MKNFSKFPPEEHEASYQQYEILSAWYSADPNQLLQTFLNRGGIDSVKGRIWAEQKTDEMSTMVHVPLASDIASFSASMLFSDGIQTEVEDKKTDDRLEEIKQLNGMTNRLIEAGETSAGMGGVYLKPTWDSNNFDFPILSIAQPDNSLPEFQFGFLKAVTFHKVIKEDGSSVYRLLERHEKGKIYNMLYLGTSTQVGSRIPLKRLSETEELQDEINLVQLGIGDILLPTYVPNKRPNKQFRGSPLGYADIQGLESVLASIDSAMSSWIRDIELGRGRVFIPEHYLDFVDGQPTFKGNQEYFVKLNIDPNTEKPMTITQFQIRMEEHKQTVEKLCSMAVNMAGYSPQSFGFNLEGGISTQSHEVRERKTLATRQAKEGFYKPAIEDALHKMLLIDKHIFGNAVNVDKKPVVTFSDTLTQDFHQTATTVELLKRAEAISTEEAVRTLHPDWSEEQIKNEVGMILNANSVDSPVVIGGKTY